VHEVEGGQPGESRSHRVHNPGGRDTVEDENVSSRETVRAWLSATRILCKVTLSAWSMRAAPPRGK